MGTAFGQVIDYLFGGTVQIASSSLYGQTLKSLLQAVDQNVVLTDNFYTPNEVIEADSVVAIGRNSLDTATSQTTRVYLELGTASIEEQFDIPVLIMVRGTGPAQKPIRDKAIGLFDALAKFVQQDLTLTVLNKGRYAVISDYLLTQTETEDDQGGGGMQVVEIAVTIQCKNYYQP